jgi:diguanylate cyclase (GGDEF)-like protein
MTAIEDPMYRCLVETSPEGIVLVDAQNPVNPVIYANPAFETMTGFALAELVGRNLRLLFWNETSIRPLKDAAGVVTHFVGHHRDAGERLRIDPKASRDSLSGAHQPTAVAVRDDRLTGLFTLPYLEELLKRDWAVAQREKRSIAIFAIDIDALDLYNTTFGRAAGDSTIRRVAHVVSGCLRRSTDVTARIDGGSLIAFAPGLTQEGALRLGQLMAERVRELRIHHPRSAVLRYISVSVGVCTAVPQGEESCESLLQKAQAQLQQAKKSGRNQAA